MIRKSFTFFAFNLSLTVVLSIFSGLIYSQDRPFITLLPGTEISQSVRLAPYDYFFFKVPFSPIIIEGNNLIIDCSGAQLFGNDSAKSPALYENIAIIIRNSKNVRLENLTIQRFQTGILIDNSEDIIIRNAEISYQRRPELLSNYQFEVTEEKIEWENESVPQSAAIYISNSKSIQLEKVKLSNNGVGLFTMNTTDVQIYNSIINYNSSAGIWLHQSSQASIMHNRIDYNFRGAVTPGIHYKQSGSGLVCTQHAGSLMILDNAFTHNNIGIVLRQSPFEKSNLVAPVLEIHHNNFKVNDIGISVSGHSEIKLSNNILESQEIGFQITGNSISNILYNHFKTNTYHIESNFSSVLLLEDNHFEAGDYVFSYLDPIRTGEIKLRYNRIENVKRLFPRISEIFTLENNLLQVSRLSDESNIKIPSGWRQNTFVNHQVDISFWNKLFKRNKSVPSIIYRQAFPIRTPKVPFRFKPKADAQNTTIWPYFEEGRHTMLSTQFGPYDFKYPIAYLDREEAQIQFTGPPNAAWVVINSPEGSRQRTGKFNEHNLAYTRFKNPLQSYLFKYEGRPFIQDNGVLNRLDKDYFFNFPQRGWIPFYSNTAITLTPETSTYEILYPSSHELDLLGSLQSTTRKPYPSKVGWYQLILEVTPGKTLILSPSSSESIKCFIRTFQPKEAETE
jgi:nitrous oxidase accessory protein NosD